MNCPYSETAKCFTPTCAGYVCPVYPSIADFEKAVECLEICAQDWIAARLNLMRAVQRDTAAKKLREAIR